MYGAGELELPPKHMLPPALPFGNRYEHQEDSAVGEIGAGNDILDPVVSAAGLGPS